MLNYFNDLYPYTLYSMIVAIVSAISILFFILRLWVFYKHGQKHALKYEKLPKLLDIQLIFLAVGIFGALIASTIPYINWVILIVAFIAFVKVLSEISKINDYSKIKPEKMLIMGIGLGISGTIGFLIGYYRGLSYKDEDNNLPPQQ